TPRVWGPALTSAAGSPPGRSSATASSGTPTPAGISPESYQNALRAFDAQLARQFPALRRARTPKAVGKAISTMQVVLSRAKATLEHLRPPAAPQSAHDALLHSLDVLAPDLANAGSAAADRQVCAGPSAIALISRARRAKPGRLAAAQGGPADPAPPHPARRLPP